MAFIYILIIPLKSPLLDSLIKHLYLLFGYYQNTPPFNPPLFIPRPAAPRPAPQFCTVYLFHLAPPLFNYYLSHFTFMNLHIRVSSTSIIAPSLSNSDMYPGALNMVTKRLFAKNS